MGVVCRVGDGLLQWGLPVRIGLILLLFLHYEENDNDNGISRFGGSIWQNWDLNPSLPESMTYPCNTIHFSYSMYSYILISHMSDNVPKSPGAH